MNRQRDDALAIWNAGVDAVRARPLVERNVVVAGDELRIAEQSWDRDQFDRVVVVGAGKAATAMATGLTAAMADWLPVMGWINVPEGTESRIPNVVVHPARPAGVNEPTEAGVEGTRQILKLVREAGPRDLCMALISGGGSALLPAPIAGVSLEDKLAVIRTLSGAGADIIELNTVRKHLSTVKGGGLLRACRAGELITLVLSDVLGDPLDVIASGPTVIDSSSSQDAQAVLLKYDPERTLPESVYRALTHAHEPPVPTTVCTNLVLGNNAVAVDQAGIRAERLGYNHAMQSATACEGAAEDVGRRLARVVIDMLRADEKTHRTDCLITGGEPTVKLAPRAIRGDGGRNQQLVLAAYRELLEFHLSDAEWDRVAILSGGTDGEDGPTDAAGAVLCGEVHRQARHQQLDVDDFLKRNDAYTFFRRASGLMVTGPTGTNVCDIRVACVGPK